MSEITAEQVARLRAAAHDKGRTPLDDVVPDWHARAPEYVREAWRVPGWDATDAALTRWHAELVAAEVPRKAPDDTAPERLRERREALGWDLDDAADACTAAPGARWHTGNDIALLEAPLAYTDSPAWDEPPVRRPAPEVVDVPQPEPWHARLVRLAQEAQAASKACAEAEAAFTRADAVRETARLVRAAARETCHVKRQALTAATTAAAIVEAAQQPATAQPTRPEPRYKVGDWVRVVTGPNSTGRINPIRVTCVTSAGYIMADGASWAAEHLTPALDPALHETARRSVAILHKGEWPLDVPRVEDLPGFDEWNSGGMRSPSWAAQLERLLGDAP